MLFRSTHRNDLDAVRIVADSCRLRLNDKALREVERVGDKVGEVLLVEPTALRTREGRDLAGSAAVGDDVRAELRWPRGQAVARASRQGNDAPCL